VPATIEWRVADGARAGRQDNEYESITASGPGTACLIHPDQRPGAAATSVSSARRSRSTARALDGAHRDREDVRSRDVDVFDGHYVTRR